MNAPTEDGTRPRVTRRRTATRAQLLEAAAAVFAEHGTTNVSVETICTRAGYTRGAFYSNFTSVDELFFALYEDRSTTVLQQLDQLLVSPAGTAAHSKSVEAVVHRVLEALPVDREWLLLRAVVMAQADHHPTIAAALRQHGQRFPGRAATHADRRHRASWPPAPRQPGDLHSGCHRRPCRRYLPSSPVHRLCAGP